MAAQGIKDNQHGKISLVIFRISISHPGTSLQQHLLHLLRHSVCICMGMNPQTTQQHQGHMSKDPPKNERADKNKSQSLNAIPSFTNPM